MTTATQLALGTVGYVILYVRDTEKAVPFYRDTLGIKVRSAEKGWAELETNAFTLALHSTDKVLADCENVHGKPSLVFNVADIHAAFTELKSRGVKFVSEELKTVCEHDGMVGLSGDFHDMDGNELSIFGWVRK